MKIQVYKSGKKWAFEVVAGNKAAIAVSTRLYASERNAVSAARLIAGSKLKVVVE